MSECKVCGAYCAPEEETGYEPPDLCPTCDDERIDCARDDYFDDLREEREDEKFDGNPFE